MVTRNALGVFTSEQPSPFVVPPIPTNTVSAVIGYAGGGTATTAYPPGQARLIRNQAEWSAVGANEGPAKDWINNTYAQGADDRIIFINQIERVADASYDAVAETARNNALIAALDLLAAAPGQAGIGVRPNRFAVVDETWNRITTAGSTRGQPVNPPNTSPIVTKMQSVAESLRATAYVAAPPITTAYRTAIEAYHQANDHSRIGIIANHVGDAANPVDPTAHWIGMLSRLDATVGLGANPNFRTLRGVTSTVPGITWSDDPASDTADDAAFFSSNDILSIIFDDGASDYKTWGSKFSAVDATQGANFQFIPIRQVADAIRREVARRARIAFSGNITASRFELVVTQINAYLRNLVSAGTIADGNCEIHPTANTPESLRRGTAHFRVSWTGFVPFQRAVIPVALSNDFAVPTL